MTAANVLITYEEFAKLKEGAVKADTVLSILGAEFPDDTCQLIAIKTVLGYKDPVEDEEESDTDPDTNDDNTDPAP